MERNIATELIIFRLYFRWGKWL